MRERRFRSQILTILRTQDFAAKDVTPSMVDVVGMRAESGNSCFSTKISLKKSIQTKSWRLKDGSSKSLIRTGVMGSIRMPVHLSEAMLTKISTKKGSTILTRTVEAIWPRGFVFTTKIQKMMVTQAEAIAAAR